MSNFKIVLLSKLNIYLSLFMAVSMLVNIIDINSSFSCNKGSSLLVGLINSTRIIILTHTLVSFPWLLIISYWILVIQTRKIYLSLMACLADTKIGFRRYSTSVFWPVFMSAVNDMPGFISFFIFPVPI